MPTESEIEKIAYRNRAGSMTDIQIIDAMQFVTFLPASFDKRFFKGVSSRVAEGKELSEKQRAYLVELFAEYRRQIKIDMSPPTLFDT